MYLKALRRKETEGYEMTYEAFQSSIFELVCIHKDIYKDKAIK